LSSGTSEITQLDPYFLELSRRPLSGKELARARNIFAHQLRGFRNQKKESIFISHSHSDLETLVKPAAKKIRAAGVEAYIASLHVVGKNPAEKIVEAIKLSKALFAIITPHVTKDADTRDWVLFEIGAAKSLGRPVFGWRTSAATVPEPLRQITDYVVFDPKEPKQVRQMLQVMGSLAKNLP